MATKKDMITSPPKSKYRIRNWGEYNKSLVNRGNITFWFSDEAVKNWASSCKTNKPGRPHTYSDAAIRCGLIIKSVFRMALRAMQGLLTSLLKMLKLDLVCPHYSAFSRRAKSLVIPLRPFLKAGEKLNVIFDSTGVKVFGEGEWKVRKHGYSKRRTWRKVHVGMCVDSGQVVVSAMSSNNVTDEEAMIYMMDALDKTPLGDVIGDGAYDTVDCREAIYERRGRQIIPPDKNAKIRRTYPSLKERNEAVKKIQDLGLEGRRKWKYEMDYHRRSRVETLMYRYKKLLGETLTSRKEATQVTEVLIKLDALNRMTELGMPECYKLAG